jgi:hypothetical protein
MQTIQGRETRSLWEKLLKVGFINFSEKQNCVISENFGQFLEQHNYFFTFSYTSNCNLFRNNNRNNNTINLKFRHALEISGWINASEGLNNHETALSNSIRDNIHVPRGIWYFDHSIREA